MGVVICSRHGRQLTRFAAPAIAREIHEHAVATAETIYALKPWWCEVWLVCPVDVGFLAQNAIAVPTSTKIIVVDDEERADKLMEGMAGTCRACSTEYLNSNNELSEIAAVWRDLELAPRLPNSVARR